MLIRKAAPGHGRDNIVALADFERSTLDEVADLESRLARIRDEIVRQARARTAPPRTAQIRSFMR
jgi:hypothetical protein